MLNSRGGGLRSSR